MAVAVATESRRVVASLAEAVEVVVSEEFKADAPLLSSFVGVTLSPTFVFDEKCTYELAFLPLHTGCATEHSKTVTTAKNTQHKREILSNKLYLRQQHVHD